MYQFTRPNSAEDHGTGGAGYLPRDRAVGFKLRRSRQSPAGGFCQAAQLARRSQDMPKSKDRPGLLRDLLSKLAGRADQTLSDVQAATTFAVRIPSCHDRRRLSFRSMLSGELGERVCAFARRSGQAWAVAVAPRLIGAAVFNGAVPLGGEFLGLHGGSPARRTRRLSGSISSAADTSEASAVGDGKVLPLQVAFQKVSRGVALSAKVRWTEHGSFRRNARVQQVSSTFDQGQKPCRHRRRRTGNRRRAVSDQAHAAANQWRSRPIFSSTATKSFPARCCFAANRTNNGAKRRWNLSSTTVGAARSSLPRSVAMFIRLTAWVDRFKSWRRDLAEKSRGRRSTRSWIC